VINVHPESAQISLEIFKKITSSLEDSIEKANRQIRETKEYFSLPDACGVALIVNRDNTALEPVIAYDAIHNLMYKKNIRGEFRFDHIDIVIYVSDVHFKVVENPNQMPMQIIVAIKGKTLNAVQEVFLDQFTKIWGEFRGVPVEGFEKSAVKDLRSERFVSLEKDFKIK
jgi:hypothetical protein